MYYYHQRQLSGIWGFPTEISEIFKILEPFVVENCENQISMENQNCDPTPKNLTASERIPSDFYVTILYQQPILRPVVPGFIPSSISYIHFEGPR